MPFSDDLPMVFWDFQDAFDSVWQYDNPLYPITKKNLSSSAIVTGLSALMATVSQQTADLIGKFRIGFTADKESAKEGLQQLVTYQEPQEHPLAEQPEQWHMQEEHQQQSQPAILGIL